MFLNKYTQTIPFSLFFSPGITPKESNQFTSFLKKLAMMEFNSILYFEIRNITKYSWNVILTDKFS